MATSEGIPSSIDIELLELNDNPYVSDGNHNCANCAENGFDCHAVNHQYK